MSMLVGLVGRQRVGKDHTAETLVEEHGFVRIAFADRMKKALYDLNPFLSIDHNKSVLWLRDAIDTYGWETAKDKFPELRLLLQRFGTEMGRDNFGHNFWVDLTWHDVQEALDFGKSVVITDMRFANEIERVADNGGLIWRIERWHMPIEVMHDPKYKHASEKDWRVAWPDVVLMNPGKLTTSTPTSQTVFSNLVHEAMDISRIRDPYVKSLPMLVKCHKQNPHNVSSDMMSLLELEALTCAPGTTPRGAVPNDPLSLEEEAAIRRAINA